jgi:protein KRI1
MPTRFRYVPVAQVSFGLSASEILLAEDKDLNEYVGLKKLAPFRKQRSTWDTKRGERLREFKNKISGRLGEADATGIAPEHDRLVDGEHKAKKRKGKKERMREKAARAPEEAEVVEMEAIDSPRQSNNRTEEEREEEFSQPVKKKRRRQKKAENPVKQAVE